MQFLEMVFPSHFSDILYILVDSILKQILNPVNLPPNIFASKDYMSSNKVSKKVNILSSVKINSSIWRDFLSANSNNLRVKILLSVFMLGQCSKWTGTHRSGVPVREILRYHRSVSWRFAGTHQNAVPVRYLSIIITFSLHTKSVLEIRALLSPT